MHSQHADLSVQVKTEPQVAIVEDHVDAHEQVYVKHRQKKTFGIFVLVDLDDLRYFVQHRDSNQQVPDAAE